MTQRDLGVEQGSSDARDGGSEGCVGCRGGSQGAAERRAR